MQPGARYSERRLTSAGQQQPEPAADSLIEALATFPASNQHILIVMAGVGTHLQSSVSRTPLVPPAPAEIHSQHRGLVKPTVLRCPAGASALSRGLLSRWLYVPADLQCDFSHLALAPP